MKRKIGNVVELQRTWSNVPSAYRSVFPVPFENIVDIESNCLIRLREAHGVNDDVMPPHVDKICFGPYVAITHIVHPERKLSLAA